MNTLFKNEKELMRTLNQLINALDNFQKNADTVNIHSSKYPFHSYFTIDIKMRNDRKIE